MNIRPEPVDLKVSIINGTCVVTGTYDYDPRLTQHQALIAAVQRDNGMVHGYKALFDAMWNDAHSYETL